MTNIWTITPVEWEQKKLKLKLKFKKSKPLPKKTKLWLGCGKLKWGKQKVNTTKLSVKVGPDMALKKKTKKKANQKNLPPAKNQQNKKLHCPFAIFSSLKK